MTNQTELLKTQFEVIAKVKSSNFRSNCLGRADKVGIDRANVPMPKDFYQWLLSYQSRIEEHRKRFYLRCEYTGERVSMKDIEIDHRAPISRGGSFGIDNLAITSSKTNQHKSELRDNEFMLLLSLLNQMDVTAKNNVLSRLRRGGGRFSRR